MILLLWLALSLHADPCAFDLDGPIDLTGITLDRAQARDTNDRFHEATRRLARREKRLERLTERLVSARDRLSWWERALVTARLPLSADARRVLETEKRRRRMLTERTLAKDAIIGAEFDRFRQLSAHPEFRALRAARSDIFGAQRDAGICREELERAITLLDQVRGTIEWEMNHAFDPRSADRIESAIESAQRSLHETDMPWERARDHAVDLGLTDPAREVPWTRLEGEDTPLTRAAHELAHRLALVRHLEFRLEELRARIEARLESYVLDTL